MRLTLEHRFDAPVDHVVKAANSDEFQALVQNLPNVGERTVTGCETAADGTIHRVTRYKLGSQLPAPVVAVLGQTATWDEVADFDPHANRWTFEIRPHVLKGRLRCTGSYAFASDTDDTTTRTVDVDIQVKVPLVGGRAEREIKKALVETMDAEAAALTDYLAR